MGSREIVLWLDERWYNALSKHLKDETLEEHLEGAIDEMCNQLPRHEYERISQEIWQEKQRNKEAAEAGRRFAVFHVTEGCDSVHFLAEENLEMLQTAVRLRRYIRKQPGDAHERFVGMFPRGECITAEQFDTYVRERLDNTGRVVGAFDIDLDKGTFDTLHIMDGWQRFRVQDVSAAAYYATKKSFASWENQWTEFLRRLEGKELLPDHLPVYLKGKRKLRADDIYFEEEVIQDGHLLEFYMETAFDVDKVFGTYSCTFDDNAWLNIYAYYDMEKQCVCDDLTVTHDREEGTIEHKYRLSDDVREAMRPKMEAYCKQRMGITLSEARAEYLSEQESPPQMEPTM